MMRVLLSVVIMAFAAPLLAATPPHVIVILTDDQGWGDLSLHGNTNLRTPHIDSLAQEGARFKSFYVQPVCSPTRAEFLTGRWHSRGGVRGVSVGQERLNLDEVTIADAFRQAGYATACFGKWHNGSQYPYHPLGRGFQEYYGFTSGHWGTYFDAPLDHNGLPVRGVGYLPDDLTQRAINFLTENARQHKPSFIYLAYNTPHSPMQVPDGYWNRFKDRPLPLAGSKKEDRQHSRAAYAMIENLDDNIGKLLASVKQLQLDQQTIMVYFHDNGPNGHRWNAGLKGIKGSTDEGGVRSPLHIRYPGTIPAGTELDLIAAAVDLYPTLVDLARIPRVGDRAWDGISLAPWLRKPNMAKPERYLYQHWAGKLSVRSQTHRLDANGALFNMTQDEGQTQNIAAQEPEVVETLQAVAKRFREQVLGVNAGPDQRPFPVGYPQLPRTVLPARDGLPVGEIRRSAAAPNCSYFTNWTSPEDRITWAVEVKTAGRYEAILHYTCPPAAIGTEIVLKLGEKNWTATLKQAHDPPLLGQEQDRVKRVGESYVKDFKPLSLGEMDLPAGGGILSLSARNIPAKIVADVRAVELVLKK